METKPSVYMYVCIYNVIDTQIRKKVQLICRSSKVKVSNYH